MDYELRPAVESDREFCFRLNEACFRARIEQIRGWNEAAERRDAAAQFRAGSDSIVLVDGRAVGHVAIEEHHDRVELRMLLLAPDAQRRGIGSSLIRGVIERARARQLPMILWVTDWNVGAIRLYRRFGFEVVEQGWDAAKQVRKLRMATPPSRERAPRPRV